MKQLWFPYARIRAESKIRIVCFPYAGAGASIYKSWTDRLGRHADVLAAQPPGREGRLREKAHAELYTYVQDCIESLEPYLDKPILLFGHSLGALAAFEAAREMRRRSLTMPAHLIVSGSRAPQTPKLTFPMHQLPDREFIEALRGLGGTPPEVLKNGELMQLFLPMLRADFSASECYHYNSEPPLDLPITAIGGTEDPEVSRDQLDAWAAQTTRRAEIQWIRGGHFFIHSQEPELLHIVAQTIDSVLAHK
ncbi:MAG: thioesterase II family protein [Planctomycetota bacterium]